MKVFSFNNSSFIVFVCLFFKLSSWCIATMHFFDWGGFLAHNFTIAVLSALFLCLSDSDYVRAQGSEGFCSSSLG